MIKNKKKNTILSECSSARKTVKKSGNSLAMLVIIWLSEKMPIFKIQISRNPENSTHLFF
jgi:hypothetical protein